MRHGSLSFGNDLGPTLAIARRKADAARRRLAEGFDPSQLRMAERQAQLAHSVQDARGRACNRTEVLEQRRTMMQAWADHLDKLRKAPTDGADGKR